MTEPFEKESGDLREHGIILALIVLILSLGAHVGLMFSVSDCAFAPLPDAQKKVHKNWTKDRPVTQVRKLDGDPLKRDRDAEGRPAAAPVVEKTETRVDRLADAVAREILPEMPAAAPAPSVRSVADPVAVTAAQWTPRADIARIEEPMVPDDEAALPRVIIPKVPRAAHAPDLSSSYDLATLPDAVTSAGTDAAPLGAPAFGGGGGGGGTGAGAGTSAGAGKAAAAALAAPLAPAAPSVAELAAAGALAKTDPTPLATLAEAPEKKKDATARKTDAAARAAVAAPPPAPPAAAKVDVQVVAAEKEAVRTLRDGGAAAENAASFEQNVSLGLGVWRDPEQRNIKYFRVRLAARPEEPLPVIAKDVVFLLDASGSIGTDRLKACRKAVSEALRNLNGDDRFNVVAFRDRFTYCFTDTAWKSVTQQSLEEADDWMSDLTAHGQTDVFRTLRSVLAMPRDPARPVVALAITDGEATSGVTRSAEIIARFAALNDGLVSIYMYGVKKEANACLMDMLTRASRGGWSRHEGMRWRAAAGLPDLLARFARPVLSDVSVIFASSSNAESYPRLVPHLDEKAPIEIYGVCPAGQREIVFSVRGLNGRDAYETLFRLSFDQAEELDETLRTEWASRRLYELVAAYVAKPSAARLRDLHAFAARHHLEVPYEKELNAK